MTRLPEEATLYLRIWTGQKCLACGCDYRYLRRFVVERRQTLYNDTQASVEAGYTKAATDTADTVFPCPHCGYIQPDMMGTRKAVIHGGLTFAMFFLPLISTFLAAFDLMRRDIAAVVAGAFGLIALAFHLYQVRYDPNRDRLVNLNLAQKQISDGLLRMVNEGGAALVPVIKKPTDKYTMATAILCVAIVVFILPAFVVELPFWLFQVAGIILFIWAGSTFGNAALLMKKLSTPREVIEVNTTMSLDETVPADFQKKKKGKVQ